MAWTRRRRIVRRVGLVLLSAAVPTLTVAGAAVAHVSVSSGDAVRGGEGVITFRVPNEMDNASTVKVRVFFPPSQPLAAVSVQPHAGWGFTVRTVKLQHPISSDDGQVTQAVSEVDWTADSKATAIKPGEFDEFNLEVGPFPNAPSMVFKALQTYSDGTVVRWIDPSTPGAPEPEHPAPTLTLVSAPTSTSDAVATGAGGSSGSGRATAALVVSLVALAMAVAAVGAGLLRRRGS